MSGHAHRGDFMKKSELDLMQHDIRAIAYRVDAIATLLVLEQKTGLVTAAKDLHDMANDLATWSRKVRSAIESSTLVGRNKDNLWKNRRGDDKQ